MLRQRPNAEAARLKPPPLLQPQAKAQAQQNHKPLLKMLHPHRKNARRAKQQKLLKRLK
jgi:hypothetical protein